MEPSGNEMDMDQKGKVEAAPITSLQAESCEAAACEKTQETELQAMETDARDGSLSEERAERSRETPEEQETSGSSYSSSYSTTRPSDSLSEGGADDGNCQSTPELGKSSQMSTSAESEPPGSHQTSTDHTKTENSSLQNLLCASVSVSPCEEALEPGASKPAGNEASGTDYYFVKWINWKGERTPVITQSENGPCPLIAIMNILFLRWKVKLPPQKELITAEELMAHLGDCILSIQPQENSEALQLNFQQNVNDAMTVLSKLSTGLDVNVRFTGVSDFEYTPECIVFDLLSIPLYHGWLVDPQSAETVQAVGKLSYNQLVEKIITCKHSSDPNHVTEGLLAEQYLESSAAQLTYHGLCELMAAVKEGELSVFFRNNHFSTLIKHKGHLYLLVTDQGFLQEEKVIWESLHNVEGDSSFCDSDFHLTQHLEKDAAYSSPQQRQVDQDYMIALSLQQQQQGPLPMSDLELARQLQKEEYQQQLPPAQAPPQSPQQARPQSSGRPASERRQRQKESDCVLL
ncbi:ubiquitin carboxyl-terminal hydrolase MINDY-1 [Anomaloglossus baeobatrachus]|uniref:ubiquitin carboxyl-terminal hydrolase MINDY-1 n=1 Tax=Anomaloglossus baeobatrachus TaxID=238106 RepID=UPI003F50088E